ncbi:hypothetical protein OG762_26760 [Streptomyces sp. NBC_01136]|uniref:hypothetical protein n=1 Tax=unclassified Streptomyces TaxID=2593676 RepID=UPI003250DE36|nr:hypothetical protein OG762_26760 [Streptomyces sp. NBC_01136]
MTDLILRLAAYARTLFSPRGRHRAGQPLPPPQPRPRPTPARHPGPYATDTPLDGRATALIRPYLLTPEQRSRRRALWLATYGIDVGPRHIHGMEVAR